MAVSYEFGNESLGTIKCVERCILKKKSLPRSKLLYLRVKPDKLKGNYFHNEHYCSCLLNSHVCDVSTAYIYIYIYDCTVEG